MFGSKPKAGAKQLLEKIKNNTNEDSSIHLERKEEITECILEVEDGIERGKAPKYAFKYLVELSADIASVASLIIQLGQLLGLIAPQHKNHCDILFLGANVRTSFKVVMVKAQYRRYHYHLERSISFPNKLSYKAGRL